MKNKSLNNLGNFKIALNGRSIRYTLRQSQKARLIWIKIEPETGLIVTVPRRYDHDYLENFLISKSSWIIKHLDNYERQNTDALSHQRQADSLYYLGSRYSFIRIPNQEHQSITINEEDKTIILSDMIKSAETLKLIKSWLINQSKMVIAKKTEVFSHIIAVKFNRIYLRDQKTRWGSCSVRKNLSFNWRIVMMPEKVIDYVIIHELCHLKHMNHSATFWEMVALYCPDWKIHRKWLHSHSLEIHRLI